MLLSVPLTRQTSLFLLDPHRFLTSNVLALELRPDVLTINKHHSIEELAFLLSLLSCVGQNCLESCGNTSMCPELEEGQGVLNSGKFEVQIRNLRSAS